MFTDSHVVERWFILNWGDNTSNISLCYCSALASAIKLKLMVLAFAMNFFSTATESCKQKLKIRQWTAYTHKPKTSRVISDSIQQGP